MGFSMPPNSIANFEIQKYYQHESNLMVFIQKTICLKK